MRTAIRASSALALASDHAGWKNYPVTIEATLADGHVKAMEYLDRYVVEDGEWKISYSKSMPLWTLTRPLGEVTALVDNMPIEVEAS